MAREKSVMQAKFEILELKIKKLNDEVYGLKEEIIGLVEVKDSLLKNPATGAPRQTAQLEEALYKEQSRTKRLGPRVAMLTGQVKALQKEYATMKTKATYRKIEELEEKVKVLEEERVTVEPLIEVGVAVRKRFLEQARSTIYSGEERGRANRKVIKEGNDRCHRAYRLADAALFRLSYLSGSDDKGLYCDIYTGWPLENITNSPTGLLQALDYYANIQTVQIINDGTTFQNHRKEALGCWGSLLEFWNAHADVEIFNANEDVAAWISQLHDLQAQIIRIDRSIEYREETMVSTCSLVWGD